MTEVVFRSPIAQPLPWPTCAGQAGEVAVQGHRKLLLDGGKVGRRPQLGRVSGVGAVLAVCWPLEALRAAGRRHRES